MCQGTCPSTAGWGEPWQHRQTENPVPEAFLHTAGHGTELGASPQACPGARLHPWSPSQQRAGTLRWAQPRHAISSPPAMPLCLPGCRQGPLPLHPPLPLRAACCHSASFSVPGDKFSSPNFRGLTPTLPQHPGLPHGGRPPPAEGTWAPCSPPPPTAGPGSLWPLAHLGRCGWQRGSRGWGA